MCCVSPAAFGKLIYARDNSQSPIQQTQIKFPRLASAGYFTLIPHLYCNGHGVVTLYFSRVDLDLGVEVLQED